MDNSFDHIASAETIEKTIAALQANNITAELVQTKEEAKDSVLSLVPKGSEVMTMTSITLQEIGVLPVLNESGEYNSIRTKLNNMNRQTQSLEMQKLGAAPEYTIGSVHAITEDGKVIIASNTGSQLPAYVYGSSHVIWVVGTQKIVKDVDTGIKRIYEYILPKESVRLRKQYNLPDTVNSNVSKLLIINKEAKPERIHLIFVNEALGF